MSKSKVCIITLGCPNNEIDSDRMVGILQDQNHIITNSIEEAEIIVVNTCAFIQAAKEESIEIILKAAEYKQIGNCKYLLLAGCLGERYSKELLEEITEIDGIIGTGNIDNINNMIKELEKGKNKLTLINNIDTPYLEDLPRQNCRTTEYVKISEGCNNHCTYCIIPKLRGKYRSRRLEDIIKEVEYLVHNGVKEIILVGQNTSDYGIDLYGSCKLHELLDRLNEIEELKWIRILYLYPDNISKELIDAIKNNKKVVKYLDIPLQHINNRILNKMNRKITKDHIIRLLSNIRKEIPDIILRTTFIVGFPGETEEEFIELYNFISSIKFDRLGVFTYSQEEGTPANKLPNQINKEMKNARRDKIMQLQQSISLSLNERKVGQIYEAIIEDIYGEGIYIGRTYMDSPEIDGIVYIESKESLQIGQFIKIIITDGLEYDLIGEIAI